jgi:hypothetical protein
VRAGREACCSLLASKAAGSNCNTVEQADIVQQYGISDENVSLVAAQREAKAAKTPKS